MSSWNAVPATRKAHRRLRWSAEVKGKGVARPSEWGQTTGSTGRFVFNIKRFNVVNILVGAVHRTLGLVLLFLLRVLHRSNWQQHVILHIWHFLCIRPLPLIIKVILHFLRALDLHSFSNILGRCILDICTRCAAQPHSERSVRDAGGLRGGDGLWAPGIVELFQARI
jgi:hypothetical protein